MDIVFLCGGEGTRLRPLTYAVPKPMLPIGSRPILEINVQRAKAFGFTRHFFMVNYKPEVIKSYFGDGTHQGVFIEYFEEKERRGTAGPLFFLKDILHEPFLVMNADVLTDLDLAKLLYSHRESESILTLALKRVKAHIPYGVAQLDGDGTIRHFEEKPKLEFLINSGVYAVSPDVFQFIPPTGLYHMTQLVSDARAAGLRVSGYVFDDSWRDIGRMDDYLDAINERDSGFSLTTSDTDTKD